MQIDLKKFYEITDNLTKISGERYLVKDKLNPTWYEVVRTGLSLRDNGLYHNSIWCFEQVLINLNNGVLDAPPEDIHKMKSVALSDIALCYSYMNDNNTALKFYEESVSIWPENAEAYGNAGATYEKIGNIKKALIYNEKALELNPELHNSWNTIGMIKAAHVGQIKKAITFFDKAIEYSRGTNTHAWVNKGNALLRLNEFEKAIKCYDRAYEIDPLSNVHAMLNKATVLYNHLNKPKEALKLLNKVKKTLATDHPNYVNLISLQGEIKKSTISPWRFLKSLVNRRITI